MSIYLVICNIQMSQLSKLAFDRTLQNTLFVEIVRTLVTWNNLP